MHPGKPRGVEPLLQSADRLAVPAALAAAQMEPAVAQLRFDPFDVVEVHDLNLTPRPHPQAGAVARFNGFRISRYPIPCRLRSRGDGKTMEPFPECGGRGT